MIVAIIPAYNEEDTIGSVVLRTKRHVDKVIVVDDGSKDKTADVAQLAGAEVVQHIQNGGKGSALKTGFKVAEKLNADVVVCLDADAQHNPDDIPRVVAPILLGDAKMVIASRFLDKEHRKDIPRYRRFGLWVLTKSTNFGSDKKITDTQCGFRAFSGDIIGKFRFQQKGFSIESQMIEDAIGNKIKIKEVSVSVRYDGLDTSSEKPGKHGLGVLGFIIRTVKDRRPLLFFGVSGAVLLLIGLGLALYCLDTYFKSNFIPFAPSLAAAVAILLGALSVFTGLILTSISGMLRGVTLMSPSREETLPEDIDEKEIQRQTPLSRHRAEKLVDDFDTKTIQRQPLLNLYPGQMLIEDIDEQRILGLTMSSRSREGMELEDIDGEKIPGIKVLSHNGGEVLPEDVDGEKIPGIKVLSNNGGEKLPEDIDEKRIPALTPLNNHRRRTSPEDVDKKKIQI